MTLRKISAPGPGVNAPADWSQWRGPLRDGHCVGFKAPAAWPKTLTKKWSVNVGESHASPIVAGGKVFTITRHGEEEWVQAMALATGKVLWTDKVAAPYDSVIFPARRLGKCPRSTPMYVQGKLYTTGVNGTMTCFDATSGKIVWRVDPSKRFRVPMPVCGASLSPLLDGKKLYVHIGHEATGAFLAIDRETGKDVWACQTEGPAYTSPVMVRVGGQPQIVTATHNMWCGFSPVDGKQLWTIQNRQNMFNHNSITPLVVDDMIVCGANQRPTFAIRIKSAGGKMVTEKVWETRDVTMSTSSPILVGDRIIAVNEKRRGQLTVMEKSTGKVIWMCDGNKGESVTVYAMGQYVAAFSADGMMHVYKPSAAGLDVVAVHQVADSQVWASPAVFGNQVLVKGAEQLNLWEIPA